MKRYPERYSIRARRAQKPWVPTSLRCNLDKVMGLAYWGAVDYLGESLGWPLKGWNKGVFDMTMLPKPDAYFVKKYVPEEPLVHIGPSSRRLAATPSGTASMWLPSGCLKTGTEARASSSHSIPIRMPTRWNCC